MGVAVDEVSAAVSIRTRPVSVALPVGEAETLDGAALFALDARVNNSVRLVNKVLAAGGGVERLAAPLDIGARQWPAGAFLVMASEASRRLVQSAIETDGLRVRGLASMPDGPRVVLRPPRVGLYRAWGGNIDEGWTRFVLEQFGFAAITLRNADIQDDHLDERVDTIVLPDASYQSMMSGLSASTMPAPFAGGLGPTGVAALYAFVSHGGTLVALDTASELPLTAFGLPIDNVLAGVGERDFLIPGSLIQLDVDTAHPLAWGVPATVSAFFARGLAFAPSAARERGAESRWPAGTEVVASYAREELLQSGWQLGGDRLSGRAALV